jgi:hypothetical protein
MERLWHCYVHFVEADNLTVPAISYEVRTLLLLLML